MTAFAWTTGVSDDWGTAADWTPSAGAPPNASTDTALINAAGSYTVDINQYEYFTANAVTLDAADATLEVDGKLALGGPSATLIVSVGTFELSGILFGGTIEPAAGTVILQSGATLDDVTWQGPLVVSYYLTLYLVGGLTVETASGGQPGYIDLTAGAGFIHVLDSETLNNATMDFGSVGSDYLYNADTAGGTLTLGNGFTITATGGNADNLINQYAGDAIVDDGQIDFSGGAQLNIQGGSFTNAATGTITLGTGSTLNLGVAGDTDSNAGMIVATGATINIAGAFTNTGSVDISDSTVTVSGSVDTAFLNLLSGKNDTITITGVLDNSGVTLTVGTGTGLGTIALNGGTIVGGTIADAGSGLAANSPIMDGVTYEGTIDLSASGANLTVVDGITLKGSGGNGPGDVELTGNNAQFYLTGTTTLDNATIDIGSSFGYAVLGVYSSGDAPALTLGKHLTLDQVGGGASLSGYGSGGSIDNQGTILADFAGGNFVIGDNPNYGYQISSFTNDGSIDIGGEVLTLLASIFTNDASGIITVESSTLNLGDSSDTFSNAGTITVTDSAVNVEGVFTNTGSVDITGSDVTLGGSVTTSYLSVFAGNGNTITITGTLDNTGATLTVGSGTALGDIVLANGGTIIGGTIVDDGSGLVANAGTLDGVTYEGTLDLSTSSANLTIADGITLKGSGGNGPGDVELTGNNAQFYLTGTTTLDNATIDIGSSFGYAVLGVYSSGDAPALTLGKHLTLDQVGGGASLSGYGSGGSIDNHGTILADFGGGQFYLGDSPNYGYQISSFTNDGSIDIGGEVLTLLASIFTNDASGIITVESSTLNLGDSSDTFSNAGTITVTDSAVNVEGVFTNTGSVDITGSDVTLGGSVTTSYLSVFAGNGNTITITGTLDNTGATLTVGSGTALGDIVLANGGTIIGGTIVDDGSGLVANAGTLDGVTYEGTLDLSTSSANLTIADGITLKGSGGNGPGDVELTGNNAQFYLTGTTTLDNATIDIGSSFGYAVLGVYSSGDAPALTLGKHLTLDQVGGGASLSGYGSGGSIDNHGTILADFGGGQFYLGDSPNYGYQISSFTNDGSIDIGGEVLTLLASIFTNDASGIITVESSTLNLGDSSDTFSNAGTITVTDSAVNVEGVFTNTGSVDITGSDVTLGGSVTTSYLSVFAGNGNTITITGTLDNTGATLTVGSGTALGDIVLANGGTIIGGTIVDDGSGLVANAGTLDGVTYEGTLDLSTSSANLTIADGITLKGSGGNGPGDVELTGNNAQFYLTGTTTLDNATIDIGSSFGYAVLGVYSSGDAPALTLGKHLTLDQVGGGASLSGNRSGGSIDNQGTILADLAGGNFVIGDNPDYGDLIDSFTNDGSIDVANGDTLGILAATTVTNTATGTITVDTGSTLDFGYRGAFSNAGKIALASGSTLELYGNFNTAFLSSLTDDGGTIVIESAGSLDNTGTTLHVGTGSTLGTITLYGAVVGGTIADGGAGFVFNSGVLDGVTYEGTLDLSASGANLAIDDGITLEGTGGTGTGTVELTGSNAQLYVEGTTLDNATINIGNADNYAILGASVYGGPVLTLGTHLTLNQVGMYADLSANNYYQINIDNEGTILADFAGGAFLIGSNPSSGYSLYSFTNDGSIDVANGETLTIRPQYFTNLAGTVLTGGAYSVEANSVIELDNYDAIATLYASITLNGAGSEIQSYSSPSSQTTIDETLTTIGDGGVLTLGAGRVFDAANALDSFGEIVLNVGTLTPTALSLEATGRLLGHGELTSGVTNAGTIEAEAGLLKLDSTTGGAGAFRIDNHATLELVTATASGETITFNGLPATLKLDAPTSFAGRLANLVPGDTIDVAGFVATTATISGTTLTVNRAIGTPLTYTLATAPTGYRVKVASDGVSGTDAGSDLTIYGVAEPGAHSPQPVAIGNAHLNSTATHALSLANNAPTNGYYENLDASLGGPTAGVTAAGSFTGLAAGATNASSLVVGLDTSSVGVKSGTATITLTSDGTGVDGLGTQALGTQTVTVTGAVYRLAAVGAHTPEPVALGNVHVGGTDTQKLTLGNTAAADGYSENLDASIGAATAGVTATGAFSGLAAGASNSSGLIVGLSTTAAGAKSGTATITLTSDGAGVDGLGITALGTQTVTVTGDVYRLAAAGAHTPQPVALGNVHLGGTDTAALTLGNTAAADGYSENLDASIGAATSGVTASGGFSGLAAGASNDTALIVGLSTMAAGAKSGTATITLTSDGTGVDGLGTTALGTQTVTVTGAVYRLAAAGAHTPEPVNLGNVHLGGTDTAALTLGNTAAGDGYSENLDASIGAATTGVTASGAFSGLAAGASNSSSLVVGLDTATVGANSGTATITLTSDGTGVDGLGTTSLGTQTVTVTGAVYRLAAAGAHTPEPVALGNVHVGGTDTQALTLGNTAAADGYSENLDASIGAATAGVTASGAFSGLAAGASNTSSLIVGLSTTAAGAKSGTATITLTSDGAGVDGLGTTALGTQTVTITGAVYRLAAAGAHTPQPVALGNVHLGGTDTAALTLGNTAAADGYSENLDASIGAATAGVTASGAFSGLVAGASNGSGLAVGLDTSAAGAKSGTATITLTSDGTGIDGLGTTALGTQTVTVTGAVYRLAAAGAASPDPVGIGNVHLNATATQALTLGNTATADGYSEKLDASIGAATPGVTASGAFTGLAAGAFNTSGLVVGLDTATVGAKSGTATITLTSDGAGVDGLGTTALGTQTVDVTGAVYRLAAAGTAMPNPAALGDVHVGGTDTAALTLGNTAAADGYSENLDAGIGAATTGVTASGGFIGLAAGASDSSSLVVGLDTATAGSKAGTATITLTSDGAGVDNLGTTALGTETIDIVGAVYRLATASQAAPNPVSFGIVHVGDTVAQQDLTLSNTAAADNYSENLDATIGSVTTGVTARGSFTGLAAQESNDSSLMVGIDTAQAAVVNGTATITLTSDGSGVDLLGTTAIGTQIVDVTGTVNNYAVALWQDVSAGMSVANGGTIDLGRVVQGTGAGDLSLAVENSASGPADLMSGSFAISAAGGYDPFRNSGFDDFTGIVAGSERGGLQVALDTMQLGIFTETITVDATGSNTNNYSGAIAAQTITVEVDVVVCFLAGTHIMTPAGEVAVEQLRVGDAVVTLDNDGARPIRWIGRRRVDARAHPRPELVLPVRIRKGAFRDGTPHRDLLVSPDHAIHIDGLLVPARLLLNGATIFQDRTIAGIEYFHIELDRHAILFAEGLASESYLDTGNRGLFENAESPVVLHPDLAGGGDQARREAMSCAPFAADAARVQPLWRRLAERARQLGHRLAEPATTRDPTLRIRIDDREYAAAEIVGRRHIFVLPRGASSVRLVSRATRPCDLRPWVDDRRKLGVAIDRIVMSGPSGRVDMAADHPLLAAGWWAPETDGRTLWCWTDGDALLPLAAGMRTLEVQLTGEATYRRDADADEQWIITRAKAA